ncbi:MAG: MBL fold metallo-hydrolase [Clostridia bacterium]|nr:MBL fold metallo-hydrolase [Clostridia bacterium]
MKIEATNATVTLCNGEWKIDVTDPLARVRFYSEELASREWCEGVYASLSVREEGEGRSPVCYAADGVIFDYALPRGKDVRLSYEAKVFTKESEPSSVALDIIGANGVTLYIGDIRFEDSRDPYAPLLGGASLVQMPNFEHLGMGYLVRDSRGKVFVIDGGCKQDGKHIASLVRAFGGEVEAWLLTHYHKDHISAITDILRNEEIAIKQLIFNFPEVEELATIKTDVDEICLREFYAVLATCGNKVEKTVQAHKGDAYCFGEITVKVLNNPYYYCEKDSVNNSGVIYKLETGDQSVLFLGDMADRGDVYLQEQWFADEIASCAVVQMSHHGQHGVTDAFYAACKQMRVCLYSAQPWVYDATWIGGEIFGNTTLDPFRTRDIVRERGITRIYTLRDGYVTVY